MPAVRVKAGKRQRIPSVVSPWGEPAPSRQTSRLARGIRGPRPESASRAPESSENELAADGDALGHSVNGDRLEVTPEAHPFVRRPHRTLIGLSFPVMLSLIPEPLTGLVDTAFVKILGAGSVAALGVGATLFSVVIWAFNFLAIGTQTEVAHAYGSGSEERSGRVTSMALALAGAIGLCIGLSAWPLLPALCGFMGAEAEVADLAVGYLEIRLLGGPAVLATMAALGALRGLHDMRTPLRIAVAVNVLNVILDAILITGWGPVPALGVPGAAWATVVSQWVGAVWALRAVKRSMPLTRRIDLREARSLLVVGRDLFFRTGLLVAFILLTTRAATRIGADSGAAQQAIRQVWLLTALMLDAYAASAQSLVGYFLGAGRLDLARRVCGVACAWGFATGVALMLAMLFSEAAVADLLVPNSAHGIFLQAWWIAACWQPVNALSFVTDGIHWGARDYRYLRDAMLVASGLGAAALFTNEAVGTSSLIAIWWITGAWIALRAGCGMLRIWPGVGAAPLA